MHRFTSALFLSLILLTTSLAGATTRVELMTYFSGDYDSVRTLEELYLQERYAEASNVLIRIDRSELDAEAETALALLEIELALRLERARNRNATISEEHQMVVTQLLNKLRGDRRRATERWARASEAIGTASMGQWQANQYAVARYFEALEWWAGSEDIEKARSEYLRMVDRWIDLGLGSVSYTTTGPGPVSEALNNAIRLAGEDKDLGKYQYHLASYMSSHYHLAQYDDLVRIRELYAAALENSPPEEDWYASLVISAATFAERQGHISFDERGILQRQPDYILALAWLDKMPDYDENSGLQGMLRTVASIRQRILNKELYIRITKNFLPGEQPDFNLHIRNLERARVEVYRMDPIIAVERAKGRDNHQGNILNVFRPDRRDLVASANVEAKPERPHYPVVSKVNPTGSFSAGFYLIVTKAGEMETREYFTVGNEGIIAIHTGEETGLYVANVETGKPVSGAQISYIDYTLPHNNKVETGRMRQARSELDGFVRVESKRENSSSRIVVARGPGGSFSFYHDRMYTYRNQAQRQLTLYAYADRPVYRPGDEVGWKAILRQSRENTHSIPDWKKVSYSLTDRNRQEIASGTLSLSTFGTIDGTLTVPDDIPLGPVYLTINDPQHRERTLATSELFSIEEYRTPEYKVTVRPADEEGAPSPGSEIEVLIALEYYFGGPVADAEVTISVNEQPYHPWFPIEPFPWLTRDSGAHLHMMPNPRGYSPSQQLTEIVARTDAEGKVRIAFSGKIRQDSALYTVNAVAQDSSRRIVSGKAEIKASDASYFAFLNPESVVVRTGATAEVNLVTRTINETPLSVDGVVIVEKLENRRPRPGMPRIIEDLDAEEMKEVARIPVTTNAEGLTRVRYKPGTPGYYRFRYFARDNKGYPIRAEATVWCVSEEQEPIWYRAQDFDLILEKPTGEVGKPINAIVVTPRPVEQVLVTVLADSIIEHRAVRMQGTTQFITFTPDERWIPNVTLVGAYYSEGHLRQTAKEVEIAATRKLLDLELTMGTDTLRPRDTLDIGLSTKDYSGRAVRAEVSVAVVDEAIYYIRPDFVRDIRAFFYGNRRYIHYNISGSGSDRIWAEAEPFARKAEGVMVARERAEQGFSAGSADPFAASPQMAMADMSMAVDTMAEPVLRTDFRDTAFWAPAVITSLNGEAEVAVTFPDTTTSWKILTRAVGEGTTVGTAEATVRTRLPLIARLQMPRFLIVGDEVYLSGVFNNNTDEEIELLPELKAEGVTILGFVENGVVTSRPTRIRIPAQSAARADWLVRAETETTAKIQLAGLSREHSDAMEMELPVHEHGIDQLLGLSGRLDGRGGELVIELPEDRKTGTTTLELNVSPSLAASMLDAIPYLISYAYGCTEQTLSRFIPLVAVRHMLNAQGIDPALLDERFREDIITSGHARADKLQETGSIDQLVDQGLQRLLELRKSNGSWGWFSETASDDWMTAYALWSLQIAKEAGIAVESSILAEARQYLVGRALSDDVALERRLWVLYTLAYTGRATGVRPSQGEQNLFTALNRRRDQLSGYNVALLALTAHYHGNGELADELLGVLTNSATIINQPDSSVLVRGSGNAQEEQVIPTASWGESRGFYFWRDNGIEATSFALMAMLEIKPGHELVEPAMNWLVKNRRGNRWTNTRDTAFAILAVNRYFQYKGDLEQSLNYRLLVNGREVSTPAVNYESIISGGTVLSIEEGLLRSGENLIEIKPVEGYEGNVYFSATARFFNQTVPIQAAGNDIFVRREMTRITKAPTLLKGYVEKHFVVGDESQINSGDQLRVTLLIDARYDTEYALIEDLKGAGIENVTLTSGRIMAREVTAEYATVELEKNAEVDAATDSNRYTGRSISGFQEIRDRRVAHFFDRLPKGIWEITYTMNVETPGQIHVLPASVEAMYAPDLRGNSDEYRLTIE